MIKIVENSNGDFTAKDFVKNGVLPPLELNKNFDVLDANNKKVTKQQFKNHEFINNFNE